jgi:Protein of unknown function (DUF429)
MRFVANKISATDQTEVPAGGPLLLGCDFSSSPSRRKPIVVAFGVSKSGRVQLSKLERFESLEGFSLWLSQPSSWIGGFDLPFGLPRELVEALHWPTTWLECIRHFASLDRATIRNTFAAFCDARPVGGKFAHRKTDGPAGSSPSMKWVNPPVAYMLHAGVPALIAAGAYLPGLHAGEPSATVSAVNRRVALEAYPGLLAREILGKRSYKSDDKAKQSPDRLIARKDLIHALEAGQTRLALRLKLTHSQRDLLVDDASGDALDATLCLMQAAWAHEQHAAGAPLYGLPPDMDPLEGWIVSA